MSDYVVGRLPDNARRAIDGGRQTDFAELYFLKYVLDAMVRIERFDLAEQTIDAHFSPMRDRGAWGFWECLHRGADGLGSFCHSWSSTPLEYLSRYVLGIRGADPGEPNRLIIDPRTAEIDHAEGIFPHPLGPVSVSWRRQGGRIGVSRAEAPAGVDLIISKTHADSRPARSDT